MSIFRSPDRRLAAFSVVLVPYLLLVKAFWWVDEDAFISFRYAYNLAHGHGLRFNVAEDVPVEGYSNFLWVLWSSVLELLGADVTFWVPLTSILAGAILLYRVFVVLTRFLNLNLWVASLATLSLAMFPPFAVWSTSGLETVPVVLVQFIVFEHLIIRHEDTWRSGLAGLALTLLRVEGLAWAMLLGFAAILSNWLAGRKARLVPLKYFGIVATGFAIFLAWRYSYYESLIANTAHAKNIGLSLAGIERGLRYVAGYTLAFLTPLLILPGAIVAFGRAIRPVALPTLALTLAPIGYSIAVGGDYMPMGRFLVSMLPFSAVLFGLLLNWLWERNPSRSGAAMVGATAAVAIAVGLLPAAMLHVVPQGIRSLVDWKTPPYLTEVEKWHVSRRHSLRQREMALALKRVAEPGDTLVTHAIGNLGYYSDIAIYDQAGLIDREVAARPVSELVAPGHDKIVPPEFFLKDKPTMLEVELVPRRAFDRTMERFQHRAAYLRETYAADYVTDTVPLEVNPTLSVRRTILMNLVYPFTGLVAPEHTEDPPDYEIVLLRKRR